MSGEFLEGLEERITSLEGKMETVIETNKQVTELLEFFKGVRVGATVIGTIFRVLRWIGVSALLIWGAYYAIRHGTAPPNPL